MTTATGTGNNNNRADAAVGKGNHHNVPEKGVCIADKNHVCDIFMAKRQLKQCYCKQVKWLKIMSGEK